MVKRSSLLILSIVLMMTLFLAACNGSNNGGNTTPDNANTNTQTPGGNNGGDNTGEGTAEPAAPEINTNPVTLKVYTHRAGLTEEEFQRLFVEPVKSKYPHITLELIIGNTGPKPEELVAAGEFPDIVFTANPALPSLAELGLLAGMDDLIKKYNVDISKFDPAAVDVIQAHAENREMIALPFTRNIAGLFYNKAIFDKFGIDYPTDGMTWEDAIALGEQFNRTADGIYYSGLHAQNAINIGSQLSLPYADPETNKALMETDGWKKVIEMIQQMYASNDDKTIGFNNVRDKFLKDQTVALYEDWGNGMFGNLPKLLDSGGTIDWDVVQLPTFPEASGVGRGIDVQMLLISSVSKNRDQAFNVIDYLTSKDVQMLVAKGGKFPAMTDPELEQNFGADLAFLQGKNIEGMFKNKTANLTSPTQFDDIVKQQLNQATNKVINGELDVNTALRQGQEAADTAIQEQLGQ